jgi:predicted transcriptional regulator
MEMLYPTAFPTEPQTGYIKKTDRNAEIIARYKTGETGAKIAKEFGISEQRVNQIIRGQRN